MKKTDDIFQKVANYTYDWETWFSDDGEVNWINPAVERMTGYSIDECLAMPDYPLSLVHEQDRANLRSLLESAKSGTSGNDVEFRIVGKNGALGWAAVSWQPLHDKQGGSLGFRTSIRDITERKRAEDQLWVAKSEAERANAAKTRFLAAVSHDLRQPLQAISMYLGALKHSDEADRQTICEHMESCLNNCNELLDDLVDISRLDAGVVVPQLRSVAIADILETVEWNLRSSAENKQLDLRFVACSAFVECDPAVLTRVLQNLVSNAIRYTPKGKILVGCKRRGANLAIQVWDTGIGISEDELSQVFEEFYQIDNPQRDRRRGAGLGLAIVRRLVDLLDAQLSVRSVPGQGSVFSVEVPVSTADAVPIDVQNGPSAALVLEGVNLLVIDDEPGQLRAITLMLSMRGAAVVGASDAEEAIAELQRSELTPDLIIADYRLEQGGTGAEALERIGQWLDRVVPGLILTGDTEPKRIAEAEASGFKLLHKPIRPETLMQAILELRKAAA